MQLSAFSDYSLRTLMHAALRAPGRVTIDEVSEAFGVNRNHLVKIVHRLGSNGLLATQRGMGGGFTLAQPAEAITLGRVLRVTEADETVISCQDRTNGPCRIFPVCLLKGVLGEAAAAFFAVLDRYSVADLVKNSAGLRQLLKIEPPTQPANINLPPVWRPPVQPH